MRLLCTRCGRENAWGTLGSCPHCGGILLPVYDDARVAQLAAVAVGPGLDRYRTTLPVSVPVPYLGEGNTPLLPSHRIGPALGVAQLYFKHEGLNPSGTFKDRVGALAAALALAAGAAGILTASSGNAAAAIAAYSAAAGLPCAVLFDAEAPPAKIRQTVAYGAQAWPVAGLFTSGPDVARERLLAIADHLNYYLAFAWAPVNAYVSEGVKTMAYEVTGQLPGTPDAVVTPVGGGDMLAAQWRGYRELQQAGVIDRLPRMIGVQSLQAAPLLCAFLDGATHVPTLPAATSRISGINVPFSGDHALAAVRASGGAVAGVDDAAVFAMQRRLAVAEGIWVEPVGAVAVAALPGLIARGEIDPAGRIVCILSGAGFKDQALAAEEARAVSGREPLPFAVEEIVHMVTQATGL